MGLCSGEKPPKFPIFSSTWIFCEGLHVHQLGALFVVHLKLCFQHNSVLFHSNRSKAFWANIQISSSSSIITTSGCTDEIAEITSRSSGGTGPAVSLRFHVRPAVSDASFRENMRKRGEIMAGKTLVSFGDHGLWLNVGMASWNDFGFLEAKKMQIELFHHFSMSMSKLSWRLQNIDADSDRSFWILASSSCHPKNW